VLHRDCTHWVIHADDLIAVKSAFRFIVDMTGVEAAMEMELAAPTLQQLPC
jgi:hypothetical protein